MISRGERNNRASKCAYGLFFVLGATQVVTSTGLPEARLSASVWIALCAACGVTALLALIAALCSVGDKLLLTLAAMTALCLSYRSTAGDVQWLNRALSIAQPLLYLVAPLWFWLGGWRRTMRT